MDDIFTSSIEQLGMYFYAKRASDTVSWAFRTEQAAIDWIKTPRQGASLMEASMPETTNTHEFANDISQHCTHCGTTRIQMANGLTTCRRRVAALCPEPHRRELQCEDQSAIIARMAELRAERDKYLNTPASET